MEKSKVQATKDENAAEKPAVLTVQIKFNGPVEDDQLDVFTELLDEHMGHTKDVQEQRWVAKSEKPGDVGWGMGRSLVTDVERVKTYPYEDGDVEVIGPETILSADRTTIAHKGENYKAGH